MPMSYSTLLGSKGSSGAIATWAAYNNLDTATILDEAQSIIFQSLRIREMRSSFTLGLSIGQCKIPLPPRFLDPIGDIIDVQGNYYRQKIETDIVRARTYQPVTGGNLPANPIVTGAINTSYFTVNIPNHGLTQGSNIVLAGLTSPVDGIGVNGSFPVTSIVDANHVTCFSPNEDEATAGGVTGGGASGTWTGNMLAQSSAQRWAVFDENIQFDCALNAALQGTLMCFRSPPLLSATNPTNFLTSRYPMIIRTATLASAAAYMKDDDEEQKWMGKLEKLILATNAESDLTYRGASFGTDTPGGSDYSDGGLL